MKSGGIERGGMEKWRDREGRDGEVEGSRD